MRNRKVNYMAINAMIAVMYVVMTMSTHIFAFGVGPLSIRLAQILLILPFYNPKLKFGVLLGVALSNISSPLGPIDVVVGVVSNAIPMLIYDKLYSKWFVPFAQSISVGVLVGWMLNYTIGLPLVETMFFTGVSTLIVTTIGVLLFEMMMKNSHLKQMIEREI